MSWNNVNIGKWTEISINGVWEKWKFVIEFYKYLTLFARNINKCQNIKKEKQSASQLAEQPMKITLSISKITISWLLHKIPCTLIKL